MANRETNSDNSIARVLRFVRRILAPERSFYILTIIYGIGISLLSLATPVSVQMLINTVANTGLRTPLVILSLTLFVLLAIAGALNALRIHVMDLCGRRFYARMVSEIALRSIYAVNPFFEDSGKGTLFNRYFDIIIVLKSLPNLLISGFTVLLQVAAGVTLVSFYHPLFLGFSIVVMLAVWLVWKVVGKRAIESAVELSHRKHMAAAWLEGLGESNGFFKSERHINHALTRTDQVTGQYIEQHARHFRDHFTQTLWFLFIYAAASAGLLGLGGWLVIEGQLTLGQLVAAELVLSVAFFGVSQLGIYLTYFYDLCGAIDELALFYDVEQESFIPESAEFNEMGHLALIGARGEARGIQVTLDFEIPGGARVMAHANDHAVQRMFTAFLKRHAPPVAGLVSLGGVDLAAVPTHVLRQQVIVLDRPNFTQMTIRQYLELSRDGVDQHSLLDAIDAVGLTDSVSALAQGLDTPIAPTGWPLSITETMQLKLAAAVIARPRVLVLSQLYDVMPGTNLIRTLDMLQSSTAATVIYFTQRDRDLGFDAFLELAADEQPMHEDFAAFERQVLIPAGAVAEGPIQRLPNVFSS